MKKAGILKKFTTIGLSATIFANASSVAFADPPEDTELPLQGGQDSSLEGPQTGGLDGTVDAATQENTGGLLNTFSNMLLTGDNPLVWALTKLGYPKAAVGLSVFIGISKLPEAIGSLKQDIYDPACKKLRAFRNAHTDPFRTEQEMTNGIDGIYECRLEIICSLELP
jgi:hypothetical protein